VEGDVAGRRLGDRHQAPRPLEGGAQERQEAPPHLERVRLGEEHGRQVVDGDDAGHRAAQRQGGEGRPEEVHVPPRQPPRQPELLPEDAEGRRLVLDPHPRRLQLPGLARRPVGHPHVVQAVPFGEG
jgi:hypothetical protein